MATFHGRFLAACLLAVVAHGCKGANTDPPAPAQWRDTRDGFVQIDTASGFRNVTRCWTAADDPITDCVWIGGSTNELTGDQSFTAERWFSAGQSRRAGPPDPPLDGSARFSCHLTYRAGQLDGVHQILTFKGGELKNERWLQTRNPGEGWSEPDILQWSERADTPLSSPLLDCEKLGRLIQTGGWQILGTSQWTGPNSWASDGLATFTP